MEDSSKNSDVLGPPPSYDSVMYGTDGGHEATLPQANAPPLPAQYPHAPYTYPVPPSYPVNPAYPGAASQPQYPIAPRTAIIQPTIVTANQPRTQTRMTGRRLMKAIFCLILIPIMLFVIFLFIFRLH